MKHAEHWKPEDRAMLADIEASRELLRTRRNALFAKIRMRAFRAKSLTTGGE